MNTWTPGEVADLLGTSRKRVTRAAQDLGLVDAGQSGARVRFSEDAVNALAGRLGVSPAVTGLSRMESLVLAELARRPFGLISYRAAARACAISPASASKAIQSLARSGLVTEERAMVALGHAREMTVVKANVGHPRWTQLLSELARVRPAAKSTDVGQRELPSYLRHAFWNVADTTYRLLDTRTNGTYIADRALSTRDPNLLSFAASHLDAEAWHAAARARGRTAPDQRLAENLANGTQ